MLASGLALFFAQLSHAASLAEGTVYVDLNRNGRLDSSEPGVASVGVSNGRDVVQTDRNGHYSIGMEDGDAVFVIKPAGYALPVDSLKLPRFYYFDKPSGSPHLKYAGLDAAGPLPATLDFALVPETSDDRFSIVVLADPQPGIPQEAQYFERDVVGELVGHTEYRFGITLGDIVFGTLSLFDQVAASLSRVGIPWFNVIGNHDINMDATTQIDSEASFNRRFGPATYAFNEGQVHFIVLNCIIHPAGDPKDYAGGLTEREFAFVENDLRSVPKDRLVVVAMHYPLVGIPGRPDEFPVPQRQRLFRLLGSFPHTLSLSGHTHFQSQWYVGAQQGWPGIEPHHHFNVGTASGDWWNGALDGEGIPDAMMTDGTPNGYATIQFDGVKYQIDYKVARAPADYRMNVTIVPSKGGAAADLYANYFLGSSRTEQVVFRIDGGAWRSMTRTFEIDPAYRLKRKAWHDADPTHRRNEPSPGVPSTHLWKGVLPAEFAAGAHEVEVRVMDVDGRIFSSKTAYAPTPRNG